MVICNQNLKEFIWEEKKGSTLHLSWPENKQFLPENKVRETF